MLNMRLWEPVNPLANALRHTGIGRVSGCGVTSGTYIALEANRTSFGFFDKIKGAQRPGPDKIEAVSR